MSHFRSKGFTLIELLIVAAIIGILAAIAIPNFLEAQVRAKVARAVSDMRNVSLAIESYNVDEDAYPGYGQDTGYFIGWPGCCLTATVSATYDGYFSWLYSFVIRTDTTQVHTISTPVEYITTIPTDPFGALTGTQPVPYGYWTIGGGGAGGYSRITQQTAYILYSFGPDLGYQTNVGGDRADWNPINPCDMGMVCNLLNPRGGNPTQTLIHGYNLHWDPAIDGAFTYDATNGTVSHGDIWRTGP
jgi:prepilin-type N-terminal cleavage/methylation domain-containing protein